MSSIETVDFGPLTGRLSLPSWRLLAKPGARRTAPATRADRRWLLEVGVVARYAPADARNPAALARIDDLADAIAGRSRLGAALRRGVDLALASLALVVTAPALGLAAAALSLSAPGPALLAEQCLGRDGRSFRRFRLKAEPERAAGRFIRRLGVDRWPEFWNVLAGDMALVGPEPQVAGQRCGRIAFADLALAHALRRSVRPGMTGPAQVKGLRGPIADPGLARRRLAHDLAYAAKASPALDLAVLGRALFAPRQRLKIS